MQMWYSISARPKQTRVYNFDNFMRRDIFQWKKKN